MKLIAASYVAPCYSMFRIFAFRATEHYKYTWRRTLQSWRSSVHARREGIDEIEAFVEEL